MTVRSWSLALTAVAVALSSPGLAESPRDMLTSAAFVAGDKATALGRVGAALKAADAVLARAPADREARLQRAIAIGYRGKLKRSPGDVKSARRDFEALVAANPRDAEAQMALAGWHLSAIIELGPLVAGAALGARRAKGQQALERALALGGGRAIFPAYASLCRIQLDPKDVAGATRLAEAAVKAKAVTPIDRILQRRAAALLTALRAGNGKAAARLAEKLMPFGRFAT